MAKELTRQMLDNWGITITWDAENNEWNVTRMWRKNRSKNKVLYRIKKSILRHKNKYTPDKEYPYYVFADGTGKDACLAVTESRLVYAYFVGDIPAGYEVDHIDNNPFNNYYNPDNPNDPKNNLRLLTKQENMAKRYLDNPNLKEEQKQYPKLGIYKDEAVIESFKRK